MATYRHLFAIYSITSMRLPSVCILNHFLAEFCEFYGVNVDYISLG